MPHITRKPITPSITCTFPMAGWCLVTASARVDYCCLYNALVTACCLAPLKTCSCVIILIIIIIIIIITIIWSLVRGCIENWSTNFYRKMWIFISSRVVRAGSGDIFICGECEWSERYLSTIRTNSTQLGLVLYITTLVTHIHTRTNVTHVHKQSSSAARKHFQGTTVHGRGQQRHPEWHVDEWQGMDMDNGVRILTHQLTYVSGAASIKLAPSGLVHGFRWFWVQCIPVHLSLSPNYCFRKWLL